MPRGVSVSPCSWCSCSASAWRSAAAGEVPSSADIFSLCGLDARRSKNVGKHSCRSKTLSADQLLNPQRINRGLHVALKQDCTITGARVFFARTHKRVSSPEKKPITKTDLEIKKSRARRGNFQRLWKV
mmetsp:Transcript_50781/g.99851  ORF Transcript_50781/g.99851 Transcript_50781/m.99851 type:complete len:129 (-) Transcript_50781:27-413(-)